MSEDDYADWHGPSAGSADAVPEPVDYNDWHVYSGPPQKPGLPDDYESNYGAAAVSGVRNAAAGMAGLGDMAVMGADWVWGDDPVEGMGWHDATRKSFDRFLPEPGWEPRSTGERALSAVTEAGTAFAVPGSAGFGTLRAIPQAVRAGRAFRSPMAAARQYASGAVQNYGTNAARLGAANIAGSSAGQYAAANFDENNMAAQMGIPALASVVADPIGGTMATMRRRGAARAAAQAAVPSAKKGSRFKSVDRMVGMLRGRIDAGEVSVHDVILARDHLHKMMMGTTERLTDADVARAAQSGDDIMAKRLFAMKTVQDDVMRTLEEARDRAQSGAPLPTSAGWLGGADIQTEQLQAMGRNLSAQDPHFARAAADVNKAAREFVADEATALSPRGQGVDVRGTPESVRGVFDEAYAAADELAGDPWESGVIKEILAETGGVRPSDVRRVINNVARDLDLAQTDIDSIDADDIMERLANYAGSDGKVSAKEFRAVVRKLKNELAAKADVPKDVAMFRQEVYDRMNEQLVNRFSPANKRKYLSAMEDYSEMKRTYDPEMNRVEKRANDPARVLESKVAKALSTPKELVDEKKSGIYTVRELLKITGAPEQVAAQVKKVLRNDPEKLAEVEQQTWRAMLEGVVDQKSTSASLDKAARANEGLIDLEGEGKLLALYRAMAGDEKADAAEKLVQYGRQARFDDAGKSSKPSTTHSHNAAVPQQFGEDVVDKGARSAFWSLAKRIAGAEVSEDTLALALKEAQLSPVALLNLLESPSGAVFKEATERGVRTAGQNTSREMLKSNSRANRE